MLMLLINLKKKMILIKGEHELTFFLLHCFRGNLLCWLNGAKRFVSWQVFIPWLYSWLLIHVLSDSDLPRLLWNICVPKFSYVRQFRHFYISTLFTLIWHFAFIMHEYLSILFTQAGILLLTVIVSSLCIDCFAE